MGVVTAALLVVDGVEQWLVPAAVAARLLPVLREAVSKQIRAGGVIPDEIVKCVADGEAVVGRFRTAEVPLTRDRKSVGSVIETGERTVESVSVDVAARRLGLSDRQVRNLLTATVLDGWKVGSAWRVSLVGLIELLNERSLP